MASTVGRLLATGLIAAGCVVPAAPPQTSGAMEDVRRVVAALDDVIGQYPAGVAGAPRTQGTLDALDHLMHDATVFSARFPADEAAAIAALARAVAAREPVDAIVKRAADWRRQILANHRLTLAPAVTPSRERALQLWRSQCAGCHGIVGFGDGLQGQDLVPAPKDFGDPAFMADLAPSRAASRITDGVRGTAMPGWGAFSANERWGLAFLVFALERAPETTARGHAALARIAGRFAPTRTATADRTNAELLADLQAAGLSTKDAADALVAIRHDVAFAPPSGPHADVRTAAEAFAEAFAERRWADAERHLRHVRARLPPRLGPLAQVDPVAAARTEEQLITLGRLATERALTEDVDREVARLSALVDRLQIAGPTPALWPALRVALEGHLAAALALGLLLAGRRTRPSEGTFVDEASGRRLASGLGLGAALGLAAGGLLAGRTDTLAATQLALAVATLATAAMARARPALVGCTSALLACGVASTVRTLAPTAASSVSATLVALLPVVATCAVWIVPLPRRLVSPLATVALAAACAAATGRGLWYLVVAGTLPVEVAPTPRLAALGLYPAAVALGGAAVAALAVLVGRAAAGRRLATAPT